MYRFVSLLTLFLLAATTAQADPYWEENLNRPQIESVTLEGGPIFSQHFQKGSADANQDHGLAIAKVHTRDYGNWGVYYLSPNSVDRTSIGAGYVTDPYTIPLFASTKLELSGALGVVTGYEYAVVPLIAGEARFVFFDNGKLDVGAAVAALPYIMEDRSGKNQFGIVATTPFLSLRYKFGE